MAKLDMKVIKQKHGTDIEMNFSEARFVLEIQDLDVTFRHLNTMDRVRIPWEEAEYIARTILDSSPLRGQGTFRPRVIEGGKTD
jgi:hypothetical protein